MQHRYRRRHPGPRRPSPRSTAITAAAGTATATSAMAIAFRAGTTIAILLPAFTSTWAAIVIAIITTIDTTVVVIGTKL
jgi:hypothetical protein